MQDRLSKPAAAPSSSQPSDPLLQVDRSQSKSNGTTQSQRAAANAKIRWPSSLRELCCGDLGDPRGVPRSCREALCGSATQQLFFSASVGTVAAAVSAISLLITPEQRGDMGFASWINAIVQALQALLNGLTFLGAKTRAQEAIWWLLVIWIVGFGWDIFWTIAVSADPFEFFSERAVRREGMSKLTKTFLASQIMAVLTDLFNIVLLWFIWRDVQQLNRDAWVLYGWQDGLNTTLGASLGSALGLGDSGSVGPPGQYTSASLVGENSRDDLDGSMSIGSLLARDKQAKGEAAVNRGRSGTGVSSLLGALHGSDLEEGEGERKEAREAEPGEAGAGSVTGASYDGASTSYRNRLPLRSEDSLGSLSSLGPSAQGLHSHRGADSGRPVVEVARVGGGSTGRTRAGQEDVESGLGNSLASTAPG